MRKGDEVRNNLRGFLKPMGVIFVLAILLLAQPDLGTVVVLFVTTGDAVSRRCQAVAVHCHYRHGDLGGGAADPCRTVPYSPRNVFLEPVEDPFGSGYQLTQSLMAFGRGEMWGRA